MGIWNLFKKNREFISNEGPVYSTSYHIVYESPGGMDLHKGIVEKLMKLDNSLSVFNPNSIISKINQNIPVRVDRLFVKCFKKAQQISSRTEGAFDMTISPLVNAWGFGFKNRDKVTPSLIDDLLGKTGYRKVKLKWNRVKKENPEIMLDASAIAKGFAVDIVAKYLKSNGCRNYMVEIGGEILAKGKNSNGREWRIGISKPEDKNLYFINDYDAIASISGKAVATSGNYRRFYMEGEKKYSHTINPKSGYPVQHSMLSATVLADDCMSADAYATAFMVLGVEKSLEIAGKTAGIECYLIYGDDNGDYNNTYSRGFEKYLV